jgi:two-component system, cell cycle sensor histidine kinase and response regulator CckA
VRPDPPPPLPSTLAEPAPSTTQQPEQRRAQKMQALGRLAVGIAHDFNSFLTTIIANCQVARTDLVLGHPAIQSLDQINEASQRAARMVRQIIAFARDECQNRQVLDLEPVVRDVLKFVGSTLPASIQVETRFAPKCAKVLVNVEQIQQALLNLVTNAAQAVAKSGGTLKVSLDSLQVEDAFVANNPGLRIGTYVRLTVADNGEGMEAPTLQRIFDPFFTTKPPGQGTGLGLFIVQSVMTDHDGIVSVQSEAKQGTAFHLYFP